ncbi:hypothetical protein BDB00DRAFT_790528 [Zychaea mexicana]|uniref:uncharacterized protein n=1 Tax=Zychaea mexicana TaxID=64656 RepID=UPI0022FDBFA0|nr:uncharacterized protein BDB00DRAFT_790528 [Zychaea mexicana]KAI9490133.1 hypothetical protein BDB00DRAFT_790528 [Zychaea mexicana]
MSLRHSRSQPTGITCPEHRVYSISNAIHAGDAEKHRDELQADEHTDYDSITLLLHNGVPGLELAGMPSPVIPKNQPANEYVPDDILALTSDEYLDYRYRKSVE